MILPAEALTDDRVFDVCIAGSGPAGMTLALTLAERGRSVLLLEAGGAEFSANSQDFYSGESTGDPYFDLDVTRLRQLGGSSNHWGGWCRPFDAIDFEPKAYSPEAHWPIARADLDPYLKRARAILDIDGDFADKLLGTGVQRIGFGFSRPVTRFSEKYRETLEISPALLVALDAALVGVATEGGRVTHFRVRDSGRRVHTVSAGRFVLACGGIENSRLLLHFNAETGGRLVPEAATLGRYWMDHPHFTIGEALATSSDFSENREFFALTPKRMRELGVLNCGLRLEPLRRGSGVRKLARDLACAAPRLGEWVYEQSGRQLVCSRVLRAAWEQEPNPDSRITLNTDRRDVLGIPLALLHWQKTTRDIETVRKTAVEFGAHIARAGQGRVRLHDWVLENGPWPENDEIGGHHHMGGTRMSSTPERGIVTPDLRLWGQENMYVAGSSVFPSGGHANPTLTIVQLTLRLADHLS
ncbi:GMC oxidoreductase [Thioalkalivibrio sp.]|uniref:GMC oxidoreductase n=1 Tax=Thioalkalivibrio sp. TaxID=2093813 RepID=UPI003976B288